MIKNQNEPSARNLFSAPLKISKKKQILEAWAEGMRDIWQMSEDFDTQPSYVASILQENGMISGYFDLYTNPVSPLNIYDPELQGKMAFRDVVAASQSVRLLDETYKMFAELRDRAGQHHCLATALTMYDRARFINKWEEARVFKEWLIRNLG